MLSSIYRRYGKRVLDLSLASVALMLLAPLLLLVAAAVWLASGRPIIFVQQRPGRAGIPFALYKFRTMTHACDTLGNPLSDGARLTRLGRFLRATSLDELPELWNVLRGQMSIVGPRPLLVEYLDRYTTEQMRRHDVLPGLTGWAQVHGRNASSWEDRLALDVWYVEHYSLAIDLKIIVRTAVQVLRREGISAAGHATMPEFLGTWTPNAGARAIASELPEGIIVIGAGGHAKVVISALVAAGRQIAAVYDDNRSLWRTKLLGIEVRGPMAELASFPDSAAVIAIGDNHARLCIAAKYPLRWEAVVHPRAYVDPAARVECGAMIMAGAVVQPHAVIGPHAIVNTGATVDHDCRIEAGVHLAPGVHLAGNVRVMRGAFLGIGAVVIPSKTIGERTVVGAGSTVISDLPAGVVAVGTPARTLKPAVSRAA